MGTNKHRSSSATHHFSFGPWWSPVFRSWHRIIYVLIYSTTFVSLKYIPQDSEKNQYRPSGTLCSIYFTKHKKTVPRNEGMEWHVGNDTCQRLLTVLSPESGFGFANYELIHPLRYISHVMVRFYKHDTSISVVNLQCSNRSYLATTIFNELAIPMGYHSYLRL